MAVSASGWAKGRVGWNHRGRGLGHRGRPASVAARRGDMRQCPPREDSRVGVGGLGLPNLNLKSEETRQPGLQVERLRSGSERTGPGRTGKWEEGSRLYRLTELQGGKKKGFDQ